jgi:hypothetical protein
MESSLPITVVRIEPSRGWSSLKLRELWKYRELVYFLIWLRGYLSGSVLDVCHSHRLPQQTAFGTVAHPLWLKPNGGSRRGVLLGFAQYGYGPGPCCCSIFVSRTGASDWWYLLLSQNGKNFRGRGLERPMYKFEKFISWR